MVGEVPRNVLKRLNLHTLEISDLLNETGNISHHLIESSAVHLLILLGLNDLIIKLDPRLLDPWKSRRIDRCFQLKMRSSATTAHLQEDRVCLRSWHSCGCRSWFPCCLENVDLHLHVCNALKRLSLHTLETSDLLNETGNIGHRI